MVAIAETVVNLLMAYAVLGVVFAVVFLAAGIERVDVQARGSGAGFRLILFPGVAAMWPLLLSRWIRGRTEPPEESNPHREAARQGAVR